MKSVPVVGRLLDLVGLLTFAAGAAIFARAWIGFRGVPDLESSPDGPAWAAVQIADGYLRLQRVGVAVMVVGVVVFVLAWWVARRTTDRGAA